MIEGLALVIFFIIAAVVMLFAPRSKRSSNLSRLHLQLPDQREIEGWQEMPYQEGFGAVPLHLEWKPAQPIGFTLSCTMTKAQPSYTLSFEALGRTYREPIALDDEPASWKLSSFVIEIGQSARFNPKGALEGATVEALTAWLQAHGLDAPADHERGFLIRLIHEHPARSWPCLRAAERAAGLPLQPRQASWAQLAGLSFAALQDELAQGLCLPDWSGPAQREQDKALSVECLAAALSREPALIEGWSVAQRAAWLNALGQVMTPKPLDAALSTSVQAVWPVLYALGVDARGERLHALARQPALSASAWPLLFQSWLHTSGPLADDDLEAIITLACASPGGLYQLDLWCVAHEQRLTDEALALCFELFIKEDSLETLLKLLAHETWLDRIPSASERALRAFVLHAEAPGWSKALERVLELHDRRYASQLHGMLQSARMMRPKQREAAVLAAASRLNHVGGGLSLIDEATQGQLSLTDRDAAGALKLHTSDDDPR